ncbi:MAG: methylmalonyl Co-A mutase-associated GTPase MeaB [Halobacteriaceae archaeon]
MGAEDGSGERGAPGDAADDRPAALVPEDPDVAATVDDLVAGVLAGEDRALARAISRIEDRAPGYRALAGRLHRAASGAPVLGVTGAPGSGKSTLVESLARSWAADGETVGVVAVDPSSPYSGGAVLGDRVRMLDLEDVFVRSMGARGALGGLAAATADAVTAMDAAGVDRIVVETVGAGQNEVDVVRTADTVAVLVPPDSGDEVQLLKAGLLEVGDLFVVNKADLPGADRTVADLETMLAERAHAGDAVGSSTPDDVWEPRVLETVATADEGVTALRDAVEAHLAHLEASGARARRRRDRHAATVRDLLRADAGRRIEESLLGADGVETVAERVAAGEMDPYAAVDALLAPLEDCLGEVDTGELPDLEGE